MLLIFCKPVGPQRNGLDISVLGWETDIFSLNDGFSGSDLEVGSLFLSPKVLSTPTFSVEESFKGSDRPLV